LTIADTLDDARAFMKRYYPGMRGDTRMHVIHRLIPEMDVDVTVLQVSGFKTSGPDGKPTLRYRYGHLFTYNVDVTLDRPKGHVHGLCHDCTKAWRRANGISDDSDLDQIPYYKPEAVLEAAWEKVEEALDQLPKTKLKGARGG